MKLGRNEKCYCGSGLKYKKCCKNKSSKTENTSKTRLSTLVETIKIGLENLDIFSGSKQNIQVKDIKLINDDTLVCEFYPHKENSTDIKLEIASIMGFFNGYFRDDLYDDIKFKSYAVRAYNKKDIELLYALSGKNGQIDHLFSEQNDHQFRSKLTTTFQFKMTTSFGAN